MESLPVDHFVTSQAFTKSTFRKLYPSIDPAKPSNSQAGKVVLITGASKGIGRIAFATSFAKANPKVIILVARSASSLKEVEDEIHAINRNVELLSVPTDLSSVESVDKLWETVKAKYGHVDVLVNNAGVFAPAAPLATADAANWWSDFEINGRGTFLVTRGFLSLLPEGKKATVINLTTGASLSVFPGLSSYSLSKIIPLQIQAYVSAENPNVTAVSLHPGVVMTDMVIDAFKRFALDSPELVGGVAVWLASGDKSFLSGRYVSANWSVDELEERKEEIVGEGKLALGLAGKFGMEQFA